MAKRRRDLRRILLQAAIELFGRDGRNVTTRALAKAAETGDIYVYIHFKSKEKLYFEAVTEVVNQANQGFTDFVMTVFSGSEQPSASLVADAVRKWYSAIPQASARLLLQVLINDEKHTSPAHAVIDQLVGSIAKALVQARADRSKKAGRQFNPQAAGKTLVRALLLGKVTEGKRADQDLDEILQQWLLGATER
jgi:AcrR family transcriptional regulator